MSIDRHWLERATTSRWFGLADLGAVAIASALWFAQPGLGPWPLAIALMPWLARLAGGRPLLRRTRLEIPLLIFMVTAGVGVWAAYDSEAAWAKFWVLVSAVLFFYALAGQPRESLWLLLGLFGLMGVGIATYFLLTHNWVEQGIKIEAISRLGERWMAVRPELRAGGIGPNGAASVMAMTAPLLGATGFYLARGRRFVGALSVFAGLVLLVTALALTSSRGAWIALAAGLGVWGLSAVAGRIALRLRSPRSHLFIGALMLIVLPALALVLLAPGLPVQLLNALPGPPSAGSRLELVRDTVDLIGDFPLTGGGLQSFPGLYSQYIRNIPHLMVDYSHNLYLNVALEQGLLGLAAFAAMLAVSAATLIRAPQSEGPSEGVIRGALLAGMVVMLVHGLVTDVLYGIQGTPILFLFPALTVAMSRPLGAEARSVAQVSEVPDARISRRLREFSGTALIFGIAAFSLVSAWGSNLGAVEMAKRELAGWPTGVWDDGSQAEELAAAEELFMRALASDPLDRTANHRVGLIRMLMRNYEAATGYLETALAQDPNHRGIRKALGQSYAWIGRLDQAQELLSPLPETGDEMDVYRWWWGTQGRPDLVDYASQMATLLGGSAAPSSD